MLNSSELDRLAVAANQHPKEREYWLKQLANPPGKIFFPYYSTTISKKEKYIPKSQTIAFPEDVVEKLMTLRNGSDIRLNMILVAAVVQLLARYTDKNDITVAAPIYSQKIETDFINTVLILRHTFNSETTFKELLLQTKTKVSQATENYCYPLEILLNQLKIDSMHPDYPLFDVAVLLENIHDESYLQHFKINIVFSFCREQNNLIGSIKYNSCRYNSTQVTRIAMHFVVLLKHALEKLEQPINRLEMLTDAETEKLLIEFNGTTTEYPERQSIQTVFSLQVKKTPDKIAVVYEESSITYKELDFASDRLASIILARQEYYPIIAITTLHSLEMIVGVLAILKTGAAYLPVNPQYPEQRIRLLFKESNAQLALGLTDIELPQHVASISICQTHLNKLEHRNFFRNENHAVFSERNSAYIMYTSGSTGAPKGTVVEHRSVLRLVKNTDFITFYDEDRILQTGALDFDASTFEVWGALLNGLQLHLANKETILTPSRLKSIVHQNKINIMWLTSPLFNQLSEADIEIFSRLRILIVGGDALSPAHINRLRKNFVDLELINGYGPTENTTFSLTHSIHKQYQENIPIGRPIANSTAYILDSYFNILPVGVPGELWVGGHGVAKGYLNNPVLTDEKFVATENITSLYTKGIIDRLYRTGDLARWMEDGIIQFLGRKDQQLKIRGFRIEPGEIESTLISLENISEAAVIGKIDQKNEKYLCAYIVIKDSSPLNEKKLRQQLANFLPPYMIPAYFVALDKLPLTSNGKLDRNALPEPGKNEEQETYEPPEGNVEQIISRAWASVLSVPIQQIGRESNFFEIGGDSIKAIQACARLQKFGFQADVADLFTNPSVKELALVTRNLEEHISQAPVSGEIILTPIQQWFFEVHPVDPHHFNQALMFFREEGFDQTIVEQVLEKMIMHHDTLRHRFIFNKEIQQWQQKCNGLDEQTGYFTVLNFETTENLDKLISDAAEKIQRGINLEQGVLLNAGLFKTPVGDHLLLAIHHLVVDGISWRFLLEDFTIGYKQILLAKPVKFQPKTHSFQYWAEKLFEYANSSELCKEISYWQAIENSAVEKLIEKIPPGTTDNEKLKQKYNHTLNLQLEKETTHLLLNDIHRAYNTNIEDILISALMISLKEWAGLQTIAINLEHHGRESIVRGIDVSRTIGWFTCQFPLILELIQPPEAFQSREDELSFLVKNTKETIRRVPKKGIGHGILKYLTPPELKKDLSFKLDPEINFNYLGEFGSSSNNYRNSESNAHLMKISPIHPGAQMSPEFKRHYILDINGVVSDETLSISFRFNANEYRCEVIEKLVNLYKSNLLDIIQHCISRTETEKTPSDFGCTSLSLTDFYKIVNDVCQKVGEPALISKIYPLTPMQSGMLYHSLRSKSATAYFEQFVFSLAGPIDRILMSRSVNYLMKRYDIFRTLFIYDGLEEPMQVVLEDRKANIRYEDLSSMSINERLFHLAEFTRKDKQMGFNLEKDTLMRFALFKNNYSDYTVVWSFHHILMDGWCLAIIFKELIRIYQALGRSQPVQLEPAAPYSDYIDWLQKQDKEAGLEYWRKYLNEYTHDVSLPRVNKDVAEHEFILKEYPLLVDEDLTQQMEQIARQNQVTMSAVFQTLWGILLQKYNDVSDIVFGAVVSGRPAGIDGIERMIGLFVNTIPVRVTAEVNSRFEELIKIVHQNSIRSKPFEYLPLAEIQYMTPLKGKLIDHLIAFENYPIQQEVLENGNSKQEQSTLTVGDVQVYERSNYDLHIVVGPGKNLLIKFCFNAHIYAQEMIEKIASHLMEITRQVVLNSTMKIEQLVLSHDYLDVNTSILEDDDEEWV